MAFSRADKPVDVIIVDADPVQRRTLAGLLNEHAVGRFVPKAWSTPGEAIAGTAPDSRAIMIADIDTIGGADRLPDVARRRMPLIATSATGSVNLAVAAVRAGAVDFFAKPIGAKALIERLEAALATPSIAATMATTKRAAVVTGVDFAGFIGRSPAMLAVYDQIRRIAPSQAPVFVSGESGTGKEICAEAIHTHGCAPGRPFIAINCSAIPRELMESEIFGHVRGAFTGASGSRAGAAELADGGTLFLDEIADMDLALQAKLLRFVQTGSFRRVGGSELKQVKVRLIAATNRDPFAEVTASRFRADLFYRLHVLPIRMPPLRERDGDVALLADAFLQRFAAEEERAFSGFDAAAMRQIESYPWPGNVRQLENTIRRIVVLQDGGLISAEMLPADIAVGHPPLAACEAGLLEPLQPLHAEERRVIEGAVTKFNGSIARAAAALGISPSTIYRKRQAWARG